MQFERAYDCSCLRTLGIGGLVREVPRVRVRAVDLHGECPAALYDDDGRVELGIDFDHFEPEQIADALQGIFQEAVDTRWTRNAGGHELADDTTERAAPHPESDPH